MTSVSISPYKTGVVLALSIIMKEAWPLYLSVPMKAWGLCVSSREVGVASVPLGPIKKLWPLCLSVRIKEAWPLCLSVLIKQVWFWHCHS